MDSIRNEHIRKALKADRFGPKASQSMLIFLWSYGTSESGLCGQKDDGYVVDRKTKTGEIKSEMFEVVDEGMQEITAT